MLGGEISIPVVPHPSGLWIAVAVNISGTHELLMVIDSGAPVSVISVDARDALASSGLLQRIGDSPYFLLRQITAHGHALPDLRVRVLPRLTRLGIAGLIGLDYPRRFNKVCFHVRERRLVLA